MSDKVFNAQLGPFTFSIESKSPRNPAQRPQRGFNDFLAGTFSGKFVAYSRLLWYHACRTRPSLFPRHFSGFAQTLVVLPLDRVKTSMQADTTGRFTGPLNCARHILQTEGVCRLSVGYLLILLDLILFL